MMMQLLRLYSMKNKVIEFELVLILIEEIPLNVEIIVTEVEPEAITSGISDQILITTEEVNIPDTIESGATSKTILDESLEVKSQEDSPETEIESTKESEIIHERNEEIEYSNARLESDVATHKESSASNTDINVTEEQEIKLEETINESTLATTEVKLTESERAQSIKSSDREFTQEIIALMNAESQRKTIPQSSALRAYKSELAQRNMVHPHPKLTSSLHKQPLTQIFHQKSFDQMQIVGKNPYLKTHSAYFEEPRILPKLKQIKSAISILQIVNRVEGQRVDKGVHFIDMNEGFLSGLKPSGGFVGSKRIPPVLSQGMYGFKKKNIVQILSRGGVASRN